MTEQQIVLCTCPDLESAKTIADSVVEQRLAACVSILPGVMSVYRWQGGLETNDELLLLIKSQRATYKRLEQAILTLHPYELPEIIAVSIATGLSPYLDWIDSCCETT